MGRRSHTYCTHMNTGFAQEMNNKTESKTLQAVCPWQIWRRIADS